MLKAFSIFDFDAYIKQTPNGVEALKRTIKQSKRLDWKSTGLCLVKDKKDFTELMQSHVGVLARSAFVTRISALWNLPNTTIVRDSVDCVYQKKL